MAPRGTATFKFVPENYYILTSGEPATVDSKSGTSATNVLDDIERNATEGAGSSTPPIATPTADLNMVHKFWKGLFDPLDESNADANWMIQPDVRKTRAILGYISIMMMRLFTKEPNNVINAFKNRCSTSFGTIFGPILSTDTIYGPNSLRIKLMKDILRKESGDAKLLFGSMVTMLWYHERFEASELPRSILRAGCMVHLGENGMPLIKLFDQVVLALNQPPIEVLDAVASVYTHPSIMRISDHLVYTQDSIDVALVPEIYRPWMKDMSIKGQTTWPWARILDQNTFKNLSSTSNMLLLCRFAAILKEADQTSDVETMVIFEKYTNWLTKQRELAKFIVE